MEGAKKIEIPSEVPVLPVRNTVIFPNAAVPLIVGRPKSLAAVRKAQRSGDVILVVAQRDGSRDEPGPQDLYDIGTVCMLSKITQVEKESFQLIANGVARFEVAEFIDKGDYLAARGVQLFDVELPRTPRLDTLAAEVRQIGKTILTLASIPGSDSLTKLFGQVQDAEQISDFCCTFVNISVEAKQQLLSNRNLEKRLEQLLGHMAKEKEKLVLQNEIQSKMMERLSKDQRDHLLREQLRTIHEELGEDPHAQDDLATKIEEAGMNAEALKVAKEELARLNVVQRSSPEYHVIRTYLDWLVALPWKKESAILPEKIDLKAARAILDEDHFGIEKVKNRILQFLAVTKLKKDIKGPILCLVGPPGVGKTSLGKSIARAMGRSFVRTSLGGVRDEAEIRGHRRTYIGALPGRIIQNLKRVGVRDPLVMLDEIDKIGLDFRGDPASALLEVLDPEQNFSFIDHYLDVPFDLSTIFFITTANVVDTIPAPLRDRMEIIEMTSYSRQEKLQIAMKHLVPRIVADHGIKPEQIHLPLTTIEGIIDEYTRESGVRNLSREIAHLCRAAAEKLASNEPPDKVDFAKLPLETILGPQKFFADLAEPHRRAGVVTGLAWTPVGGEILNVEVTRMDGRGHVTLTGQLGAVMKESAQIALSLLRSTYKGAFRFDRSDFHVHVPGGAIPKDGPSAGVAIYLALASFIEKTIAPSTLAVTGEITLRGTVLPVGGIKEKVLAAHRAGIRDICLPERNAGDLADVTADVKSQLNFHFIKDLTEALVLAGLVGSVGPTPARPAARSEERPVILTN